MSASGGYLRYAGSFLSLPRASMTAPGSADSITGSSEEDGRIVPVTIFSDYTCPWCYIGSRRFDRLREDLPEDVELDVEWKPFEIHPEVPREGMPVEELGYPEEQWKAMQAQLRSQAAAEGLEITNRPKVSNTHEALAASARVQRETPDRFSCFHNGLFRAYFSEGRDLGQRQVILDVAEECGLDTESLDRILEEGRYDPILEETSRQARRRGVSGTPTFIFSDHYGAVGAQPVEYLRRVLERVLEETSSG